MHNMHLPIGITNKKIIHCDIHLELIWYFYNVTLSLGGSMFVGRLCLKYNDACTLVFFLLINPVPANCTFTIVCSSDHLSIVNLRHEIVFIVCIENISLVEPCRDIWYIYSAKHIEIFFAAFSLFFFTLNILSLVKSTDCISETRSSLFIFLNLRISPPDITCTCRYRTDWIKPSRRITQSRPSIFFLRSSWDPLKQTQSWGRVDAKQTLSWIKVGANYSKFTARGPLCVRLVVRLFISNTVCLMYWLLLLTHRADILVAHQLLSSGYSCWPYG